MTPEANRKILPSNLAEDYQCQTTDELTAIMRKLYAPPKTQPPPPKSGAELFREERLGIKTPSLEQLTQQKYISQSAATPDQVRRQIAINNGEMTPEDMAAFIAADDIPTEFLPVTPNGKGNHHQHNRSRR